MSSSMIRGKYVVLDADAVITDGAVFEKNGTIVEAGSYDKLRRRYRPDRTFGSERHVVVPGFVNSHHHVGLTPFQLGSPDLPLELWFASRLRRRNVDPYLDTLYSAFEMIQSGVTTVQHLHTRAALPMSRVYETASAIIKAYTDVGMRVSYSFGLRDQNRLVYASDEEFIRRLPPDLGVPLSEELRAQNIPVEDNFALFEQLYNEHNSSSRVRIQLALTNLHWCSDWAIDRLIDYVERYRVPVHMHLAETMYQKEYARRRTGGTAAHHLARVGLLGPHVTLGHGVWLTEQDLDIIAEKRAFLCHNASSNLRLRSGIAPLNAIRERGIRVALGIDEAGINDDRDMLQEMRLALCLHRVPGMNGSMLTAADVFRMATANGALTTPFGAHIGQLAAGSAADMCVMKWDDIAAPYLDEEVPIIDAIVHRARNSAVDTVLVDGEPIFENGRFTRVDKAAVLRELASRLQEPLGDAEQNRQRLSVALLPHVKKFYEDEGYVAEQASVPFYHFNCR